MSSQKLIGVTGGIGSGKSTVCKILEVLGVSVYYADDRAKKLMENNASVIAAIKSLFGEEAYVESKLNRASIAERVFSNKELLQKLNEAVHPAVKEDFESWTQQHSNEKVLVKEAALLIETGSHEDLNGLILVVADKETRISRVLKRDPHRKEKDIQKIIGEQLSDEEKIPLADFVIQNDQNKSLIQQVTKVHTELIVA